MDILTGKTYLIRIVFIAASALLVYLEGKWLHRIGKGLSVSRVALTISALVNIFFVIFLFFNHADFPLHLEITEGPIFQHFQRAVAFKAIYPEPTPEFVPIAYNPLYYIVAIPFSYLFGVRLFTLRLVAILGTVLSGLILFHEARQKSGSSWWGLLCLGFFAGAYHAMDNYFDAAHPDMLLLCSFLGGTYLIDRNYSRFWNVLGVIGLVASFWFKQHGAFFALGGLLYLTWREGVLGSLVYWAVAFVLGPVAYLFLGPMIFGSHFHYFTWEMPRGWSEINVGTFSTYIEFIARYYPILALSAGLVLYKAISRGRKGLEIWHVQLVGAGIASFLGAMDPGSSYNNFIPLGTLCILMGTVGIDALQKSTGILCHKALCVLALFLSFGNLMYNPSSVLVPKQAKESYNDLVEMLTKLDGNVYAPSIGQLQDGYILYPAAHWATLEDMIRGPGQDTRNHPNTRRLLNPAINPAREAFILANYQLHICPWLAFLEDYYVLDSDFGERFSSLRTLPVRWHHGWPRYLYRYAPGEIVAKAPKFSGRQPLNTNPVEAKRVAPRVGMP